MKMLFALFTLLLCFQHSLLAQESNPENNFELFKAKCSKCHKAPNISIKKKTAKEWHQTVLNMQAKDPEWISNDDAIKISEYLKNHAVAAQNHSDHDHSISFCQFPAILGIVTFVFLSFTLTAGVAMTKFGKRKLFKYHRILAFVTLLFAILHVTFVVICH